MYGCYSRVFNPAWKGHLCQAHCGCGWSHPESNTFCAPSAVPIPLDGRGSAFHVRPPKWDFRQAPSPCHQIPTLGQEQDCHFHIFFSILLITGIVADLFKYSLSFVFTGRTGLLAWSISRRNCFAVEVTNDSSAPLGCCDHFAREHMECRAQASESLSVLI